VDLLDGKGKDLKMVEEAGEMAGTPPRRQDPTGSLRV